MNLAPFPKYAFLDNNGNPLNGGQLFTYIAGTTTKVATYVDDSGVTQNTNPIILDYRGEANVWLDPTLTYKFTLAPKGDTDPPTRPIWTVDNISAALSYDELVSIITRQFIGLIFYPRTAAEIAAAITPTFYYYPEGDVRRYGADPTNVSDSTSAFQSAIAVASTNLGPAVTIPSGIFKITSTLVIAAGKQVNIYGAGKFASILFLTGFSSGVYCFDYQGTTGSRIDAIRCSNFAIWSNNGLGRGFSCSWVIYSDFEHLYLYDLQDGWVGTSSFGNGFYDLNSFSISGSNILLNIDCANNSFIKSRFSGSNGIAVNSQCDTLNVIGCDFEGIIGNGAAIALAPVAGTSIQGVNIIGCHFENINGTAIYCQGADLDSVGGLVIKGNIISGGFAVLGNTFAVNAIAMYHVNGFDISDNNVTDWGTQDATPGGTQGSMCIQLATARNGEIKDNRSLLGNGFTLAVKNIADVTPDRSISVANNWIPVNGTLYSGYQVSYNNPNRVALTYGAAVATDTLTGSSFVVTANNATPFTMSNPTNGYSGQICTWRIRNTSGGVLGAATWAGTFHLAAAWVQPANGTNRAITFEYDGASWLELYRTSGDVAN